MRIALVQLAKRFTSRNRALRSFLDAHPGLFREYSMPHLGLLTIAAVTPAEHDVVLLNENVRPLDADAIEADVVGISTLTQDAFRAYELADELRERGRYVVLGGIHPTVCPDEALEHADTVIRGEGEGPWPRFLADLARGTPERLYSAVGTPFDLAQVPPPRYELLDETNHAWLDGRLNMIPLQTSRGCPRNCSFCSASTIWGSRQRTKPVDQVIEEVREVKRRFGRPLICFADDNLFLQRDHGKELLRALADENVHWMTQSDLSIAGDPELLELCARSGCDHIFFGFESVDADNLRDISPGGFKLAQLRKAEDSVRAIQEAGIVVYASIMVGLDHDTPQVIEATRDFVVRNHLYPHFCISTPLPGTRLYEDLRAQGRLRGERYWDLCTFFDVTYEPLHMTTDELEQHVAWLFRESWSPEVRSARRAHTRSMFKGAIERYGMLPC